jgi:hypothetical protein
MRLAAIVLAVGSFAHVWSSNLADEDLWNHLHLGELVLDTRTVPRVDEWSYSAAGHAFFDHEWLADVAVAAVFRVAGGAGLLALKLALGLVVVAAILAAARTLAGGRRLHPATVATTLVLALAAMGPAASIRPQLFTMAGLAVEWALLERADRALFGDARTSLRPLALVPLVVLVWTNAHGGFVVGVALAGLFAAAVVARTALARRLGAAAPPWRRVGAVVALALATAAATIVNPYGVELHRYLAHTLGDHGRITEWMPVTLLSADHLRFKVLVAATIALVVPWWWARRGRPDRLVDWRLAFLAIAACAGFRHQRHTVLFAIAAAPVLMVAAERARRALVARVPGLVPRPPVAAVLAAGVCAIALAQAGDVAARYARDGFVVRYARDEFPLDAVEFLRANDVRGNMAVAFEWGGYTLQHLADGARVFLDGRYEASYPPPVIADYFAFVDGAPGWERVLDAYPTDVVVLEPSAPVVTLLAARTDLVRVYADDTAVVYLARTPTMAPALARLTAVARRPAPRDSVFP